MEGTWVFVLTAAIVAALVMGCHGTEGWKESKVEAINIGGKVLCQDCSQGWNQWVYGATPLKGCKVAVTCMDQRMRVVYHGSDTTDEQGGFTMAIKTYINGKALRAEGCSVRLVSSPHPTCNILTGFGGGRSGVNLRRPSHVYRDLVKYTLEPFYFTTPLCDEPDTSKSGGGGGY